MKGKKPPVGWGPFTSLFPTILIPPVRSGEGSLAHNGFPDKDHTGHVVGNPLWDTHILPFVTPPLHPSALKIACRFGPNRHIRSVLSPQSENLVLRPTPLGIVKTRAEGANPLSLQGREPAAPKQPGHWFWDAFGVRSGGTLKFAACSNA